METAKYNTCEERYFECPHCSATVSELNYNVEIYNGNKINCPECNKKVKINGGY